MTLRSAVWVAFAIGLLSVQIVRMWDDHTCKQTIHRVFEPWQEKL